MECLGLHSVRYTCACFACNINFIVFQDNVFVNIAASVQYRALADKASDAFYKLSNIRAQIQAYVFDGKTRNLRNKLVLFS